MKSNIDVVYRLNLVKDWIALNTSNNNMVAKQIDEIISELEKRK